MFSKPITVIKEEDIQGLVAEGVPERKTLDFKRDLPGDTADT